MVPPMDPDKFEKLHDKLNKKLAKWEKKKLGALIQTLRNAETEIKAALITAESWEKTRLESLSTEIDRISDGLMVKAEEWVKGRGNVQADSPYASLSQYPALAGGNAALEAVGAVATLSMVHMPVLSYIQSYQLDLIKKFIDSEVRAKIKEQLKLGYIQGESIPQIAKRLRDTKLKKGVWQSAEKRAKVIARTEILRASNQGALSVYQTYKVKRIQWLTAHDERVCSICGPLNRRVFLIDQIPFGAPPAHPRCRCFITAHVVTNAEEGAAGDVQAKENLKWWEEFKKEKKII